MNLTFSAKIEGARIRCLIGSDEPIAAPIFCFSLMGMPKVISGGTLTRVLAGYGEVLLPDLSGKGPVELILEHANPHFRPANRAWLPLGCYLRHAGGCTALPDLPNGIALPPEPPAKPCPGLRLVPAPTAWHPAPGTLDATRGFATDALPAVEALAQRTNLGPFASPQGARLTLRTDASLPPEAYGLTITPEGVSITHADEAGAFYAGITLLTLRQTHEGAIPCGTLADQPRFAWRGQHLDCARHFFETGTLHRLLDLMALLKLNRFHWHFADDEAFRLQVLTAPDLWQKTEFRGEGEAIPAVRGGGIRAGGSYSLADVAALVARAAELHIGVLPEIETPAHSYCVNLAVPDLVDARDARAELSVHEYPHNIVNPAVPATLPFLEALAIEVASLFPLGILHLGCDELPHGAWDASTEAAALKQREGLAGRDDLQGWMMSQLARKLAEQGIRTAAWEEAAKGAGGGIGHGALLFSWTGQGPGIEAARRGHDVVMCPAQNVYFDMAHTSDPNDWGASWAAFINLDQVLDWSPVPKGCEDVADRILGVEGCFWGEFTTRDAEMEAMLAPRILGLACKAWERDEVTRAPRLRQLARAYAPLFKRIDWQHHPGA